MKLIDSAASFGSFSIQTDRYLSLNDLLFDIRRRSSVLISRKVASQRYESFCFFLPDVGLKDRNSKIIASRAQKKKRDLLLVKIYICNIINFFSAFKLISISYNLRIFFFVFF